MKSSSFIPYSGPQFEEQEMVERAEHFYKYMNKRRSVREYSDKPVPRELVEHLILTAGTAPSGAHKQPWTFCLVSDPEIKKAIRIAAEEEEYENYNGRMSESWKQDLEPFATDWHKPFLEIAPWLIVIFKKPYDLINGEKHKNYYVNESVGLAAGFLISAIHQAGLVTLTHTPSPMNFLQDILKRPENERAFLLLPVGYPKEGVEVPNLDRKGLNEIMVSYP
ncbi:MAG: nitroreductase family protein [Saprospiraceae bacterium]|nr:nitroreductase family protein [Saprospiraceae bacterium]